ncbi:hypothetical protein RHSIM_Rhsim05G0162400 [Rhododendron simsii]|uniref:Uncharacterized protein n=1 Tax=Rhododendron simsii TaxID=118357 RepID=A0A834LQ60_RHOSS|nr:hypothetical protein RHSIM_Rhsim05G0162400 [Rhododendron simsii]
MPYAGCILLLLCPCRPSTADPHTAPSKPSPPSRHPPTPTLLSSFSNTHIARSSRSCGRCIVYRSNGACSGRRRRSRDCAGECTQVVHARITTTPSNNASIDAYSAIELALDSVVKIFTISSSPITSIGIQTKKTGFVVAGKRIMTNAHVVPDCTFVLVRKHGSPTKYRAEVQAVGHECDLTILTVESDEFWEGMTFLELGDIPFLQEAVAAVGYPQAYTIRTCAMQLMAIQIDVAINPGNSGGPAIMGDKVAGVSVQNLSGAENNG